MTVKFLATIRSKIVSRILDVKINKQKTDDNDYNLLNFNSSSFVSICDNVAKRTSLCSHYFTISFIREALALRDFVVKKRGYHKDPKALRTQRRETR